MAAIIAAGAAGFVLVFVVMFVPHRWLAIEPKLVIAWSLVLIIMLVAWGRARKSGTVLLLDAHRSSLTYRPSGRVEEETFTLDEVASIETRETTKVDSEGDRIYTATLDLVTTDGRSRFLATHSNAAAAYRLSQWIAQRLGIVQPRESKT